MKSIVIIFFIIYLLLLIIENSNYIIHYTNCIFFPRSILSIPLNNKLTNELTKILLNIPDYKNYTFIDFGSGFGNILFKYKDTFNNLIGIELSKNSHNEAVNSLQNYKNIKLINMSMEDYKFPNNNIILYMYEPLFHLKCKDRNNIYYNILNNLNNNNKNIYIIYIRANYISNQLINCHYNKCIFEKDFKLVNKKNIGLWPLNKKIYILTNKNY